MSGENTSNPAADFLTGLREIVASGNSAYGAIGSPQQVEKLQELDAKLALGRQLGEIPPAPEPWTVQRAASERLAIEHPLGDPAAAPMSELLTEGLRSRFDQLATLSNREQADLAGQVAEDFAYRASAVSVRYAGYRDGGYPSGAAQVDALLADAQPAIAAFAEPGKQADIAKQLRLDRQLLETFAARGRNMTAYAARKRELGL